MEVQKINPSNLMTVNDYAASKVITRQTVFNWLKSGKVKKVKFLGKEFIDKSTFNENA